MLSNLNRRTTGALLGAVMGFTYTLFSQTINYFMVPDLPLFSDGNILYRILFGTLAGAFLGWMVNAFADSFAGVVVGSLMGTAAVVFGGLSRAASLSSEVIALAAFFAYTFIPMTVLFMPLTALLRWAAGYYTREGMVSLNGVVSHWKYLRVILGLIALSILFGSFVIIPVEGRVMLRKMDDYIHNAQSSDGKNVPSIFQPVRETVQGASSSYTLEWTDDLSKYPFALGSEDAPGQVASLYNLVIARFASGEEIACLFRLEGGLFMCSKIN